MRKFKLVLALSLACVPLATAVAQVAPTVPGDITPNYGPALTLDQIQHDNAYLVDGITSKTATSADVMIRTQPGAQDREVSFIRVPSLAAADQLYPVAALRRGGDDGRATVRCTVTTLAATKDCVVVAESPAGRGFGEAALAFSRQFQLNPASKAGAPVASTAEFVVGFKGPGKPTGSFTADTSQGRDVRTVTRVVWREAPTYDQVIAVYPEAAKATKLSGHAVLQCVFGADGRLSACNVEGDTPVKQGFGEAAKRLAPLFAATPTFPDGKSVKGAKVNIPVTFKADMLARRDAIGAPKWERIPTAAALSAVFPAQAKEEGIQKARSVLDCKVTASGALGDCLVVSEEPAGYGFGKAAAASAERFVVPKWSDEGVPSVGATVRLPIAYDLAPAQSAAR